MKKFLLRLFALLITIVTGSSGAWADGTNVWEDIKIDLTNAALLTADEAVSGTALSLGVAVKDGAISRVETTDPSCDIVLSGKFHSTQHGWSNFSATVAVEGPVRISMGTCAWGGDVTVKDASGNTVATFNTNNGACYHNDKTANIASAIYKGEATTLTISGGSYTPYIAVEAVDPSTLVETKTATFSLGDYADCGVAPEAISADQNTEITIPGNYTMYKEGYTLTGWNDGTSTIALGAKYTLTDNVTLTPVFTENTKTLADRTEAVTLKWNFRRDQGAPVIAVEGANNGIGVWVTQANVAGETIDVKMDYDATSGKFNNANNTDCAQVNNGTKFTIPSAKGAAVSMEAHYQFKRDGKTATTIDGQSDYTAANTVSYTIAGSAETIDIVVGSDAGWLRYIQTVLPVVEQGGSAGKTYTDEAASVVFAMNNTTTPGDYTATPADGFSTVAFDSGDCTLTGTTTITKTDGTNTGITAIKFKPAGTTTALNWFVRPAAGLTFTPTKVKGYINRCGTDAEKGVKVTAHKADGAEIALGTYTAWRQGKSSSKKEYDKEAVYYYEIELTADQQAQLAGTEGFYLTATVGVGSSKEGAFGEVTISGKLNGTIEAVNKYTLDLVASPAEGGSVSAYPKSEQYTEGDEVQLTATQNFGYHFVNWTDAAGNVVSTDAKFTYTVTADETLTANFTAVNTYALDVTVEGGANDYMVQLLPAPTVVEGKNMYEEGTEVTLTASNNAILTFTNWSTGETSATTKVTMDGNKQLTATFSAIDYIVGWDFYVAGNNGRPADFASTVDNQSAALILRDVDGNTQGWLDKSTVAAGGYESLKGAAVNWKTLGQYYYQTKVNARDFSNIKVNSVLLYNYNAYTHITLQYSLNGETWIDAGEITLAGPKVANDFNVTLPADADHAESLYIRWLPDTNGEKAGTDAPNSDGTAISDIFIIADAAIYDDGTAPVLVSTVPANGATGASASGKIVLNYDEKVKLTENAKATLSGQDLALTVSGKTITATYKSLEYATEYLFNLAAGSVSDLSGNTNTEAVNITFTTMTRPEVTKGLYDQVVTTADEFLAALEAANTRADKSTRYRIFLYNGTYDLGNKCLTAISGDNISLIGESEDGVVIVNTPEAEGIGNTATLFNSSNNLYMQDITIKNAYQYNNTTGRAVCLQDKGEKTIAKQVKLLSFQDTYYSNKNTSRFYWEDSEIHGTVDFLCGGGDVYYNRVNLVVENRSGNVIAAPSGQLKYGYVFLDCEINAAEGAEDVVNGTYNLGRPWGANCRAQYINTKMNVLPTAAGWGEMGSNKPEVFAEYNSVNKNGIAVDLSSRKLTFEGGTQASAVLTEEQVSELSIANVMGGEDEWNPLAYTEQAPVPTNVSIKDSNLSWDSNNYSLLWAVCKNGSVVAFTTESAYTVDDISATWSVRAANEMGGLGEATVATVANSITEIVTSDVDDNAPRYNIAGMRVNSNAKGVIITKGKKIVVK